MEDSFFSTKFSSTTNSESNTINKKNKNNDNDNDNNKENIENLKILMKKEILNFEFSVEDACDLIKKVFSAASEREISIGDGVDIWIVRNNGDIDIDNSNNIDKNNNIIIDKSKKEDIDSICNGQEKVALTSEENEYQNNLHNDLNLIKLRSKSDFRNGLFRIEKRFFNLAKS